MERKVKLLVLGGLLASSLATPIVSEATCDATWVGDFPFFTDWFHPAEWDNCIPGLTFPSDDSATFGSEVGLAGSVIDLSGSPAIGSLIFNNAQTSFEILGNSLRSLQFGSPNSLISVQAGNHIVTAPIDLFDTQLIIKVSRNSSFKNNNSAFGLSALGLLPSDIIFYGPGTLLTDMAPIETVLGSFITMGGHVSNTNSATITSGIGSRVEAANFIINDGSINNSNSGFINALNVFGTRVFGSTSFSVNGGTLTNSNSGMVDLGGRGSVFQSLTLITINGGEVINSNSGQVVSGNGGLFAPQTS